MILAALAAVAALSPAPDFEQVLAGHSQLLTGQSGPAVERVQKYLNGVGVPAPTTGVMDAETVAAVAHFQDKFLMMPSGQVNRATARRLRKAYGDGELPKICRTSHVIICMDKTQRTARRMVHGKAVMTFDVGFGPDKTPTREGLFRVHAKDRFLISDLSGTPMPFSLFFSRGQALHYSKKFAVDGYNTTTLGCVIMGSRRQARELFNKTPVGGKVYVYR